MSGEECKESVVPNDPPPSKESSSREEKKKRGWFFNRSKSLKDLKPQAEDESLVRICATDRREQPLTSPEILWRRINQKPEKERWSDMAPSQRPQCPRHPDKKLVPIDPPENMHSTSRPTANGGVPGGPLPTGLTMSQSHSEGVTSSPEQDGVTLRFRRYKLSSTPETTV
ncbi:unnamed protein product [Cylicostephanus goldi]|uniref:Uncharacterized protein n=1 Tax=Cylicostephanus goldi TaxID=71465 RepID=A0A3P7QRA3_CYLGO|nr:unnamed protein product [Cylicostephanus goldi]